MSGRQHVAMKSCIAEWIAAMLAAVTRCHAPRTAYAWSAETTERTAMQMVSPAVSTDTGPAAHATRAEAEVARLRAQVAWLKAERAALWWAVGHDELTGLPNRRLFHTLAPPLLRHSGPDAAVIVLDLNGFKPINDAFGHDTGDHVLRVVAERLASCAGDSLVARFGGDEFAAVLINPHPQTPDQCWHCTLT